MPTYLSLPSLWLTTPKGLPLFSPHPYCSCVFDLAPIMSCRMLRLVKSEASHHFIDIRGGLLTFSKGMNKPDRGGIRTELDGRSSCTTFACGDES